MSSSSKTTKFFAAILTPGALLGILIGLWLGVQALAQNWLYLSMILPSIGLFAWSTYTGICLWQGNRYGRK